MTALALQHYGVGQKEVTFVGLGPDPKQIAGLEAGTVSASILDPGSAREAIKKGMHALFDMGDVVDVPLAGLATTTRLISERPGEVRAVVRGTLEGMAYMKAHPAETIAYVAREFKYDPATAKFVYEAGIRGYNYGGRIPAASIRDVLAEGAAFAARAGAKGGAVRPVPARLSPADVSGLTDFGFLPPAPPGSGS
jgi:ABC-type nitrate/sulfonate/bicarbonate transport system substrate-binding protein